MADLLLELGQRRTEGVQVAFVHGGEQTEQDESTEAIGDGVGDRRERGEGPELLAPVEARQRSGLDDQDRPLVRECDAAEQGRRPLGAAPAAVHEETTVDGAMKADPRALDRAP